MQSFSSKENLPKLIAVGSICAFLTMFFVVVPALEPSIYASYPSDIMAKTTTFRIIMKWIASFMAAGFMFVFAYLLKRSLNNSQ